MKGDRMFNKISEFSNSKKGLYFVLIVSFLIKILTLIIMNEMAINRDGTQYIAAAQQFALGNIKEGLGFYRMPFYPLIIMIVHFVIRDWLISARLISIFSLSLATLPLYLITKDLFDRRAAFWGCLAFALAPETNQLAMEVLRDPAFLFCLFGSVYFAQKAILTKANSFFFIAAVFSWIPFLFRIEGIIFAPFYFLFLGTLVCVFLLNAQERTPYMKGLIIWAAFSLLLIIPLWFVLGAGSISINKINVITKELNKFKGFQFGQSYRMISGQLKVLENSTLYASGNQNFAEVARHYMPLIYILGLVEVLIKNIFVFFLVPLVWGLKSSFKRAHIFLITFVGFYILIIFYTYVERDFIQTRFLLAPAILLYPWIGQGIQRIFSSIKQSVHPKLVIALCIIFFILMPMGKFVKGMANEDGLLIKAAEWIKTQPEIKNVNSYTNDSRIGFHAGWTRETYENNAQKYEKENRKRGVTLEQYAVENNLDLVVLRISKKRIESAPKFNLYKKVKEIKGKKDIVFFYCSPGLYDTLEGLK